MATDSLGREAQRPGQFGRGAWLQIGRRVRSEVGGDHLSMVAAGVAFYAFLSLFPALAALVSIYGMVADPQDIGDVVAATRGVLPGDVVAIVEAQLRQIAGTSASSLGVGAALGLLVALWSATKGTKSLMTALNIVYAEEEKRGFLRLNLVALGLTLGAVLAGVIAVVTVIAVPALLGSLGLPDLWRGLVNWLRWPLLAAVVMGGIAVFYRYAPSRRAARWPWVSYGALAATLLWLLASALFSWYVAGFGSYNETYGSMAAIVILLLWFYISAFVVLLGAELNSEMEQQTAQDSTVGEARPRGRREAAPADRVAGEGRDFEA